MKKQAKEIKNIEDEDIEDEVNDEVDTSEEDGVSPIYAARMAGKYPPQIYAFIRNGRLRTWKNSKGKTRVNLEEAQKLLRTIGTQKRKSSSPKQQVGRPLVAEGSTICWQTKNHTKAGVVQNIDNGLVTFIDNDGTVRFWSLQGLEQNIMDKKVSVADASSIICMLAPIIGGLDCSIERS